jgi:hypothetical protein
MRPEPRYQRYAFVTTVVLRQALDPKVPNHIPF